MEGKRPLQICRQKRVVQKLQELVEALDAEYCDELCKNQYEDDDNKDSKYSMRKQGTPNPCRNVLPARQHNTVKHKTTTANVKRKKPEPQVTLDGRVICDRGGESMEVPNQRSPPFYPLYPSVELRGGIHYNGCHCVKRNGLQDDCPRWDCAGRPECDHDPWPICFPQQTEEYPGRSQPNYAITANNNQAGNAANCF